MKAIEFTAACVQELAPKADVKITSEDWLWATDADGNWQVMGMNLSMPLFSQALWFVYDVLGY